MTNANSFVRRREIVPVVDFHGNVVEPEAHKNALNHVGGTEFRSRQLVLNQNPGYTESMAATVDLLLRPIA